MPVDCHTSFQRFSASWLSKCLGRVSGSTVEKGREAVMCGPGSAILRENPGNVQAEAPETPRRACHRRSAAGSGMPDQKVVRMVRPVLVVPPCLPAGGAVVPLALAGSVVLAACFGAVVFLAGVAGATGSSAAALAA